MVRLESHYSVESMYPLRIQGVNISLEVLIRKVSPADCGLTFSPSPKSELFFK
jgi:hypothetical protein